MGFRCQIVQITKHGDISLRIIPTVLSKRLFSDRGVPYYPPSHDSIVRDQLAPDAISDPCVPGFDVDPLISHGGYSEARLKYAATMPTYDRQEQIRDEEYEEDIDRWHPYRDRRTTKPFRWLFCTFLLCGAIPFMLDRKSTTVWPAWIPHKRLGSVDDIKHRLPWSQEDIDNIVKEEGEIEETFGRRWTRRLNGEPRLKDRPDNYQH